LDVASCRFIACATRPIASPSRWKSDSVPEAMWATIEPHATTHRAETSLKRKGTYHVRFANFDERLTVWVDRKLPFGDGVVYDPAPERGPVEQNDLNAPASIGAIAGCRLKACSRSCGSVVGSA